MNLRTFGQIKAELARVCGATGMPAADPRVLAFTNMAVEELLNENDFPWTVDRLLFTVYDRHIVLPTDYDRIIGLAVDGVPQQINSPWYEVTLGSYGNTYSDYWYSGQPAYDDSAFPGEGVGAVIDHENVFQFREIPPGPYYLRVSCQYAEDAGLTLNLRGYDEFKNPVRSLVDGAWEEGENFTLAVNPVQSASTFSQLSGVVKPVTEGEVWVEAVGANGYVIRIATFAPRDTAPFFRSYRLPALLQNCGSVVLARCRRRYRPVVTDNDFVMCGNVQALKKMLQAVWYSDAGDIERYAAFKSMAVDLLRKEALAFRGKSRVPSLSFQRGFGLGAYPYAH